MATILVEILGNAKQFKSELDGAVSSTEKANGGFAKMSKAAGVAGLALTGGLAFGLVKSVEAADEMQQSTARMNAAFAASHVSVKAFSGRIEEAEVSSRKLGFSNDQVRGSLGSLVIATHDGNKAIADLAIAEDIARFKHVSLETATKSLTMAMAGSQRATKQLGIDVPKVTTAQDAMKASGNALKEQIIKQQEVVTKLTAEHDKSKDGVKRLADAHATLSVEQTRAKEVSLSHTSAVYKNELAHAKLVDKMSTANAVIATVSEKLHGQADAYSNTAAGGMAQFHAQLGNVEEKLGMALLPALTAVAQALSTLSIYFSENMGVTKALIVGIGALAAVLLTVSVATKIAAAAQAIWTGVMGVSTAAIWALNTALSANPIGLVVIAIAALVAGLILAYQHSATFRAIVTGAFDAVKTAAQGVLDFFRNTWAAVKGLITGPFDAIVGLAKGAFGVGSALTTAMNDIKKDVRTGITDVVGFFKDLPGKIKSALGDVSTLLYNAGVSIIQGLYDGMTSKVQDVYNLASGIAGKIAGLKGPIEADRVLLTPHGQAIIEGLLTGLNNGLASLPGTLSAGVQKALDAGRRTIEAAQASFQTAWSQIASDADAAFRGIRSAVLTPAEKELAGLQSAHDKAGRDHALATARGNLESAQAGGDPAAILAAQQQLADAQYAIHIAALQKTAEAQRVQLDARTALDQRHFDEALTKLQTHLAKGHSTYEEAHKAILKLFKSFGINYSKAGGDLGNAFVAGLKESIQDAAKQSGSLSGKLEDVAAGIHIPHAATGGFVSQTGLAVIHQGETITPAGGGGGVTVIVNGWVGNDQDIAEKIRNVLIRTGRTTTGGALGGFA